MEKVVVIPTYDERDNVRPMSEAVLQALPDGHVLFVDDSSPDGTGDVLDEIAGQNSRVHVLHRSVKDGLGRAYIAGFKWAIAQGADLVFGMDADFSHDPRELPAMVEAAREADLVIGSRYVDGIRITNWPLHRLLLSKSAGAYVRLVTGIPVSDPTGGYRCYRREVLETIVLNGIMSNGYSFLVEMVHKTWMRGFRIREIPITFEDRRAGYSKMDLVVFRESMLIVWRLAFKAGFRRRPRIVRP